MVAAQAHCTKADRAVVISARSFLRALGGAIGLAVCSTVLSNVLRAHIPSSIPTALAAEIGSSTYHVPDLTSLPAAQRDAVLNAYMNGSRAVFIMFVPIIAVCLCLCWLVKDRGLQRPDEVSTAPSAAMTSRPPSPHVQSSSGLPNKEPTDVEKSADVCTR